MLISSDASVIFRNTLIVQKVSGWVDITVYSLKQNLWLSFWFFFAGAGHSCELKSHWNKLDYKMGTKKWLVSFICHVMDYLKSFVKFSMLHETTILQIYWWAEKMYFTLKYQPSYYQCSKLVFLPPKSTTGVKNEVAKECIKFSVDPISLPGRREISICNSSGLVQFRMFQKKSQKSKLR